MPDRSRRPALRACHRALARPHPEQEPKEVYPKVNRSTSPERGILGRIVEAKRLELDGLRADRRQLRAEAERMEAARPFAASLERRGEVALIAEFKRKSPSAGAIGTGDPAVVAATYAAGGAAAMSVLTDGEFFGGSLEDLKTARAAVSLPILRKDFVLDELQIWEARAAGADAVLLIVRILDDARLAGLLDLTRELRMGSLVEVHDGAELERALAAGAPVIGINNRDLDTFRTDLGVTLGLAPGVPAGRILVGESGIRDASDVDRLGEAGVDAVLVGEALMRGAGVAQIAGRRKRERAPAPVRRACTC